jgi:pilus assembly protein Flp/PilA
MTKFFRDFLRDEIGPAAAEYALILALVSTSISAVAIVLGGSISSAMNHATHLINTGSGS